eukprot:5320025-Lingulodinium_polyedra.AAC.1
MLKDEAGPDGDRGGGLFHVPCAMHSSVAEPHCGASGRGIGPLHGDTSQAPRYLPSDVTMPGPKGL